MVSREHESTLNNPPSSTSDFRYPLARPSLGQAERDYLVKAFDSGWISSSGKFIHRFETEFARYVGSNYGVATSNGTSALHIALLAAGVGNGDEVIVPDLTFISPANMVHLVGAKPVFADSNREYWGVDADSVKQRITKRTRAVIVVHLYGHPVDLDPIMEICESRSLIMIEDCAEAHGAKYKGHMIGTSGRISCFSFYGNKLLTTGEGGMCLTNDRSLDEKLRLLRDHGASRGRHFWHPVIGFNYRMTNLQAAIGCAQLKSLDKRIEKYRRIGHEYTARLSEALGAKVVPHPEMRWADCVFWMYTFLIQGLNEQKRGKVQAKLKAEGIETRPMFYPISRMPPYLTTDNSCPIAYSLSKRGLSLPTFEALAEHDVEVITDAVARAI